MTPLAVTSSAGPLRHAIAPLREGAAAQPWSRGAVKPWAGTATMKSRPRRHREILQVRRQSRDAVGGGRAGRALAGSPRPRQRLSRRCRCPSGTTPVQGRSRGNPLDDGKVPPAGCGLARPRPRHVLPCPALMKDKEGEQLVCVRAGLQEGPPGRRGAAVQRRVASGSSGEGLRRAARSSDPD